MRIYWDTSAVLKLYCLEKDSKAYIHFSLKRKEVFLASKFLRLEFFYALQQKTLRNELTEKEAERIDHLFSQDIDAGQFILIPLDDQIYRKAKKLWKITRQKKPALSLRSLDGIHVATCLVANCNALVTADQRMKEIALRLKIKTPAVK